jgi:HEAT repeat protein
MSSVQRYLERFDLQPGEGRMVGLFFLIAFGNGTARTFTRSAAYALFLSAFAALALPYVYIAVSVAIVITSFGYLRLAGRMSLAGLLPGTLGIALALLLAAWGSLTMANGAWLLFAIVVLYELVQVMTNLALWNSVGRLLNVQQVKRLSGTISTGEPAAAVIGGFLTAPLVALIGTVNLLLIAGGALAGSLLVAVLLVRSHRSQLAPQAEPRHAATRESASRGQFQRYVGLTFALYSLVIVSYFTIDNLFYVQTQRQFPDAAAMAGFIGLFNAVIAIAWTLTNAVVIGNVLRRFGLGGLLLSVPTVLLLGTLAVIGADALGAALVVVFSLAALNKLLSKLGVDGFVKVALNVIYQPLPASRRLHVQTQTEGVVYAGAVGFTGVLLLALTNLLGLGPLGLAVALLVMLAGWLLVAVLLYREYPRQLLRALARRALDSGVGLTLDDPASRAVLRRALHDPQPGVALYALQTLARTGDANLEALLPELLRHPAPTVRQEAVQVAEQRRLTGVLAAVHALLAIERDPAVRGAAARMLAATDNPAGRATLGALLADPAAEARLGTMVGLLRHDDLAARHARAVLTQWVTAQSSAERTLAAEAIGAAGSSDLAASLCTLLHDADPAVRQAALLAAGHPSYAELWPEVIAALGAPGMAKTAARALSAGGPATLPALEAAFRAGEPALQRQVARIWGRIGGPEAGALLLAQIAHPDADVRSAVCAALARCGYRATPTEQPRIQQQIRTEITGATWMLAAHRACAEAGGPLLARALSDEVAAARTRVLHLLSLRSDPATIGRARRALASASAEQRAYGLEIIDTQLSGDLKAPVLTLLSDIRPAQQLSRLVAFAVPGLPTTAAWLGALIGAEGRLRTWTRACAIAAAAQLQETELGPLIQPYCATAEPLLAETAAWALRRLQAEQISEGVRPMLSRIEKVLILKTVDIFAETPDDVLADIAALLHEVDVLAGAAIFAQGDPGTSMYIIVAGEVRVHDETAVLNHLYTRDVFGEMALLDPEPRVASVTAVTATQLLRLDQEPFYELMDERNEVARGVIRVLTRRLRARVRDLSAARAQLAAPLAPSSEAIGA